MKGQKETEKAEISGINDLDEGDEELIYENSSMWPTLEGVETVFEPQCVECPFNQGAIACAAYGEKPAKYMANTEVCPREKKD